MKKLVMLLSFALIMGVVSVNAQDKKPAVKKAEPAKTEVPAKKAEKKDVKKDAKKVEKKEVKKETKAPAAAPVKK
jgi:hypothetical protein